MIIYYKTNKFLCKLSLIMLSNFEIELRERTINIGINGNAYIKKPKVQLINLVLHAILTFSGKSYLKSQLKGISPRLEFGT
jgi:hypothetical protein